MNYLLTMKTIFEPASIANGKSIPKSGTLCVNLDESITTPLFFTEMVKTRPPETIANMAILLIKQTDYLLYRQLKALEKAFLNDGGMREKMTRMRIQRRNRLQGGNL